MRTLLPLLVIVFARCATLHHGPMQRILVDNEPVAATVQTKQCGPGSTRVAKTAAIVWVNRRATHCTLTFTAPGFESQTVPLHRGISDKMRGNARVVDDFCGDEALDCNHLSEFVTAIFLGGFFAGTGLGVDAVTGAMFEQEPSSIHVELLESPPPPP